MISNDDTLLRLLWGIIIYSVHGKNIMPWPLNPIWLGPNLTRPISGSKTRPSVARQKGRRNTRLRRGQQVGLVMIGLTLMAGGDQRRRPSAMKRRACHTNTTQFKGKS